MAWIHWVAKSCTTTAYRWLFRDSQLSLKTLWSAVIKSPTFSARGTAPSLRLLHVALVILVIKELQRVEFWENVPLEFRRLSINSVKVSVALRKLWSILSFSSKLRWIPDFDGSSQDTIQNLKRRRPSCVEDWWFFHHQLMTDISMNVFPNESYPHLRSHLVLPLILQIYRTFSSVWDLQYSQYNSDCLGNSFPWMSLNPSWQP